MNPSLEDILKLLLGETHDDGQEVRATGHHGPICDGGLEVGCGNDADLIWLLVLRQLRAIQCLLRSREFGLREIKCEVKHIEDCLEGCDGGGGGSEIVGPQTTGPIFVRSGQNNAINVKVQNTGEAAVDAEVRLFDTGACPPVQIDSVTLTAIGSCCTQDAVVTADAGDFEVVVCPTPADAAIRVFVSVHSGNAVTSAIDYVVRASEMLPLVCPFCE